MTLLQNSKFDFMQNRNAWTKPIAKKCES